MKTTERNIENATKAAKNVFKSNYKGYQITEAEIIFYIEGDLTLAKLEEFHKAAVLTHNDIKIKYGNLRVVLE